jgi:hypothetical protein
LGKDLKLSVDASYLTDNDYQAAADLDINSRYRLQLITTSFRHNLEYLGQSGSDFTINGRNYHFDYAPPSSDYSLDNTISSALFRYRLSNYPLHLNLRAWQFRQDGERQLRYADSMTGWSERFIRSKTRTVDNTVTEASLGVDGHFGPVDAIYSLVWREFDDGRSEPRDQYVDRLNPGGSTVLREHNANPESRYLEQSIALHTSMTGGVVGAASYSLVFRDNRGKLADTAMSSRPEDTVQNGAVDLNLTLSSRLSLVLRYRLLVVDKEGPDAVVNSWYGTTPLAVRPAIDLRRNHLTAAILYRPLKSTTVKAEYAGEFLHRSGVHSWPLLDESVDSHRGSLSIQSRPLKGMRLKASYAYTTTSSSSYGTSYEQRHDAQFYANYLASAPMPWGGNLSARLLDERNGYQDARYLVRDLPRDRSLANGTATIWITPLPTVTVTANYGINRNDIDQTVLFEMRNDASAVPSSYVGEVQQIGLMVSHQPMDQLTLSAAYQNIHSLGYFRPQSSQVNVAGIEDISRVDIREDVFSLRAEYRFSRSLSCSAEYALRDYDSRSASQDDGTMHRIAASLTSNW